MKARHLLVSAMLSGVATATAQVTVGIDAAQKGAQVSPMLYGIFYEDINHAADGGLYAELVRNRSFEDSDSQLVHWSIKGGATMRLVDRQLLNKAQGHALEVTFGGSGDGIGNEGFWGIPAVQGRSYKLSFWAKGRFKGHLRAYLGDSIGQKVYAEAKIDGRGFGSRWSKFSISMTSAANDPAARLWLVADGLV